MSYDCDCCGEELEFNNDEYGYVCNTDDCDEKFEEVKDQDIVDEKDGE